MFSRRAGSCRFSGHILSESAMSADILIREARIVDGSGAPVFGGDVRVRDGRVHEVGPALRADGETIVAADGRYLAPGFIDAHCHDDLICSLVHPAFPAPLYANGDAQEGRRNRSGIVSWARVLTIEQNFQLLL